MSTDLTAERLTETERRCYYLELGASADTTRCMVAEIRRSRAARVASMEQLRAVVEEAARDEGAAYPALIASRALELFALLVTPEK